MDGCLLGPAAVPSYSLSDEQGKDDETCFFAAGEAVIGEGDVGADEDIVLQPEAIPELDTALDGDAIADEDIVLHEDLFADIAIGADAGAAEDVRESPDTGPGADGGAGLDQGLVVN